MTHEEMVLEFMAKHAQYQQHSADSLPPHEVVVLRMRLIMEEVGELVKAMHEGDVVEVADALADLEYVVVGTAIAYGIPHEFVFAEVHRSNMTKAALDSNMKGGKVGKEGFQPPRIRHAIEQGIRHREWVASLAEADAGGLL